MDRNRFLAAHLEPGEYAEGLKKALGGAAEQFWRVWSDEVDRLLKEPDDTGH